MKLAEFKSILKVTLRGDVNMPDDLELLPLCEIGASQISSSLRVLELIEIDEKSFEVDFWIDGKYFVRKIDEMDKNEPVNQEQSMPFLHKELNLALIYKVAILIGLDTRNFILNERRMFFHLNNYEFDMFDESFESIEDSLRKQGFYKPYSIAPAIDNSYVWDESFLDALDVWLYNKQAPMDTSYRKFCKDFVKYQDGVLSRADLITLDKAMSERIA